MAVLRVAFQEQVQAGGVESSTHVTFEWREVRAGRRTSTNTKGPPGVIDSDGYRPNVGIVLVNRRSEVLWARRVGQKAWQFPQGGIKVHETPEQAMFRELFEEIGLRDEHVEVMGSTRGWLRYTLPKRYIRRRSNPVCIGQKQVWFLLRMIGQDSAVRLDGGENPEFDHWKWVDYWYPSQEVIFFKRQVYRRALKELAPLLDLFPTLPGSVQ